MQIKLIKPAMNRCIHSVVAVNDDLGADFIRRGIAVRFIEVRSKAVVSAEAKQAKEAEHGVNQCSGAVV